MQNDKTEFPTHLELDLSSNRVQDLLKLADYLEALPEEGQFDMDIYAGFNELNLETNPSSIEESLILVKRYGLHGCGFVGCAVGYAPLAGINTSDVWSYQSLATKLADGNNRLRTFLFSTVWSTHDNTPQGAAERIRYALTHGLPLTKFKGCEVFW